MRLMERAGTGLLLALLIGPAALAQSPAPDGADDRLVTQMGKALTNDAQSQYELAQMYEKGVGTPQDLRLAHLWYTKSAKQGYEPAVRRLASWEADVKQMELREKQREEEERARQRAEAARQARERAAADARAKQQAEEARASRERSAQEAARARQQSEAAAKAASERAAQEAAKRRQAPPAPEPPVAAKTSTTPAPVPAATTAAKGDGEKPEFSANPCKGPSAKFMSTCR